MIFQRASRREFTQSAAGVFVALFAILLTTQLIRFLGEAAHFEADASHQTTISRAAMARL